MAEPTESLNRTPLYDLHVELGGKMVPFAGYEMPVQYPSGILAEHLHTRSQAGLFDVSHMGQVRLDGDNPAAALETLVTNDLQRLGNGEICYNLFTNDAGGILDDLMVTQAGDYLFVVVNAACKEADVAHMQAGLPSGTALQVLGDRALLALQGPAAAAVLQRHAAGSDSLRFMQSAEMPVAGIACRVSRSGYTGEDGFEVSVPADAAEALGRRLLAEDEVAPIGLGARDSLRLEAGLCLYGHDIDETTTPVEARLVWAIGKRRRVEGGFPGAEIILRQIENGVDRRRVGLRPEGRAPAREGTEITDSDGAPIGHITSGGFGPTVGGPVAMGYVATAHSDPESAVNLLVRGAPRPATVVKMPFVAANYYRG
ncbi:MAG: glycine cleavage system aminomethyltransferase GcvT [Alphaproteobacteria bacterium]|nr:glycine cleavage system aminomethyltransferase GcvT [Alphaproteobacteria bacterium]